MKTILLASILLFNVNLLLGSHRQLDSLLNVLDATIANKAKYCAMKDKRMDSLKRILHRSNSNKAFDICNEIYSEYITYCADSAMVYCNQLGRIAQRNNDTQGYLLSQIFKARILLGHGQFLDGAEILEKVGKNEMSDNVARNYLLCQLRLTNTRRSHASADTEREYYNNESNTLRERILQDSTVPQYNFITTKAEHLLANGMDAQVIEELLPYYEQFSPTGTNASKMAYRIGSAFYNIGGAKQQDAMEYFALSAIADLTNGAREYSSLSLKRLAVMQFDRGDIDRAYNYMRCAMDDAILCNAKLRTLEVTEMFFIIDKSYRAKEKRNHDQLIMLLSTIIILALIITIALVVIGRQNRKLFIARENLSKTNTSLCDTISHLSDSNKIKETYIGQYMELYSTYLSRINIFKNRAKKVVRAQGAAKLLEDIDDMLSTEKELKLFYHNFDVTILDLFPDFIAQFNVLLAPGEEVTTKNGEELSAELRIFALIRLGITDSMKIAHLLGYSLSTIYNYRTKMRNKARGNRDDFENEVKRIGI